MKVGEKREKCSPCEYTGIRYSKCAEMSEEKGRNRRERERDGNWVSNW